MTTSIVAAGASAAGAQDVRPLGASGVTPDVALEAMQRSGKMGPPEVRPSDPSVAAYARAHDVSAELALDVLRVQARAVDLEPELEVTLGSAFGGLWFDDSDRKIHVSVVSSSPSTRADLADLLTDHDLASDSVIVSATYGKRRLFDMQADVASDPAFTGSAIGLSAAEDKVLVTPSTTAADGTQARITKAAIKYGNAVRITSPRPPVAAGTACGPRGTSYVCDRPLHGAVAIDSVRGCSSGYLAHSSSYHYVITAGHCTYGLPGAWSSVHFSSNTSQTIGPSSSSVYDTPNGDFGTVLMSGSSGAFWLGLLTPAAVAVWGTTTDYQIAGVGGGGYINQYTCGMGRWGHTFCGTVVATNSQVNLTGSGSIPSATVGHLDTVQCSAGCAIQGDSGGPWMVANYAQGLTSGVSTNFTYFTPVINALAYYPGVTVDLT